MVNSWPLLAYTDRKRDWADAFFLSAKTTPDDSTDDSTDDNAGEKTGGRNANEAQGG